MNKRPNSMISFNGTEVPGERFIKSSAETPARNSVKKSALSPFSIIPTLLKTAINMLYFPDREGFWLERA